MLPNSEPDIYEWQLASVLTDEKALFILWTVKTLFCTRREDLLREYQFDAQELDERLHRLKVLNFLQEDATDLVLTASGENAIAMLGEAPPAPSAAKNLIRPEADIEARFNLPKERIYVEERLMEQLQRMGWIVLEERDPAIPYLDAEGRSSYREVLLKNRLKEALRRLNTEEGKPPPISRQIREAIHNLQRLQTTGSGLLEINEEGMRVLQSGTDVSGTSDYLDGMSRRLRIIDFEHPGNNEFLALNQFRVEIPGRDTFIIPDIVLFVNGIPLVVIECKSPELTNPIESGVAQLRRYAGVERHGEGVPDLFYYNLFLITTCFYLAKVGTLEADAESYQQWKDPYPRKREEIVQDLGIGNIEHLSSQHLLVAGMLRKENLLDLLRNFVLFRKDGNRLVKLIARYQQYRAVRKAIERLQHGVLKTAEHDDQRGGIIWHTQGSGKSLTMVFLIREMRKLARLSTFKIVIITDRQDLQSQLTSTLRLTGEELRIAKNIGQAEAMLARQGDDITFIMIQKARGGEIYEQDESQDYDGPTLKELNPSPNILLIVDEAHRSHTSKLHANILNALPYAAKLGFTGTPILMGTQKPTRDIFGDFIDKYTILESEQDGATVPILYEGYQAYGFVDEEQQLDQSYAYLVRALPHEVLRRVETLYTSEKQVLEAQELIEAKAYHILLHYAANVLPNGFKAMVVARSRMATVRYQAALMKAQQQLINALTELEQTAGTLLALSPEESEVLPQGTRLLLQAYPQRDRLNQLQCAAVISSSEADDPFWAVWSDERRREEYIKRFKLPLEVSDGQRSDPLALLCVQQMLLTGFDAPVVQGLYLDRRLVGHNLLQAIARVNRTYTDKTHGLVVDYLGIARQLKEALSVYNAEDIQGALVNIQDEQLRLEARHLRVHALFSDKGIDISKIDLRRDRETVDACLNLFKDARFRADFEEKLKNFSESMDAVLPRPEALRFVHDLEILGYLNKSAANIFPEEQISIKGVGKKVRKLIDEHIAVLGIEQTVAPISITDTDFEKRIDQHISDETKASEMEHQARYYIKQHYEEDPEYYERFSQHLKRILDEFAGQWAELVEQLRSYIKKLSQERKTDATGLDPRTQLPFLDILEMEASRGSDLFGIPLNETTVSLLTPGQRQALAPLTAELVELIRGHIRVRDFWSGAEKRQDMRADIIDFLDRYDIITPTERQVEVANRLMAVARRLHRWLVA